MTEATSELLTRYFDTIDNYLNTMQINLNNINRLLELQLIHSDNSDERRYELDRNSFGNYRVNRRRRNLRSRIGRSVRSFNMSPMSTTNIPSISSIYNRGINSNSTNNATTNATTNATNNATTNATNNATTNDTNNSNESIPSTSRVSTDRTSPIYSSFRNINTDPIVYRSIVNPFSNRNNRGLSNTIRSFINNTINNYGTTASPASSESIVNNTTQYIFNDISGETLQETCPISLTTFDSSSVVLRINHCGHIFKKDSLLEWFSLNNRCPICRYNIDSNNITAPTNLRSNTNISTQTNDLTNADRIGIFDISFTIPNYLPLSTTDSSNNDVNELVESVSNVLSDSINSIMNNDNMRDLSNNIYLNL